MPDLALDIVSDEAMAALLARRRSRKPPFWLEPVLPRPYPCPEIQVDSSFIDTVSACYSAQTTNWNQTVNNPIPANKKITSKLKGVFEYEGVLYTNTSGWYGPHKQSHNCYRLIDINSEWASKIVRPTDRRICEIGYHGIVAEYKGATYILVGPEISFFAIRSRDDRLGRKPISETEPVNYSDSPASLPNVPIVAPSVPPSDKPATLPDIEGNMAVCAFVFNLNKAGYGSRIEKANGILKTLCPIKTRIACNVILGRVAYGMQPTTDEWYQAAKLVKEQSGDGFNEIPSLEGCIQLREVQP